MFVERVLFFSFFVVITAQNRAYAFMIPLNVTDVLDSAYYVLFVWKEGNSHLWILASLKSSNSPYEN